MRKRYLHIVLLLALILTSACSRKEIYREEPRLALRLRFSSPVVTKAGDVTAVEKERRLSSLQVWVFRSSDGLFLGHLSPDVSELKDGEEKRYYILVNESVAKTRPKVDVYAVANLESTSLTLTDESTRDDLNAAVMQGCFFGNTNNSLPEEILLPYSGVSLGCTLGGNFPVLDAGTVLLEKAVSKIRFVMGQVSDVDGSPLDNFTVTSISLNGNQIPTQEFLFNTSTDAYRVNSVYESDAISIPVPTGAIPASSSPELFAYIGQNAQVYESLIDAAVSANILSSTPSYYFRESPLALAGTVSYTLGDQVTPTTIPFNMSVAGDFARNHSWIVYIYYTSGKIQFTTTYSPWKEGGDFYLTHDDV